MKIPFFPVSALAMVLAACSAGPDYRRPAAPAVETYTRASVVPGEGQRFAAAAPAPDWWKSYGSEALDALVAAALANNPNIESARANLRVAQQNVVAQRGFFYPTVAAGYSRSRQNVGQTLNSPLQSGDSIYNLHMAQLSVGFVPDVFGVNRRQVESLEAQAQAQHYQLEALRVTVAANVVVAAIQEATLVESIAAGERVVEDNRALLAHARRLVERGYGSGFDIASAETILAQSVLALTPLRLQAEQTRDLIAVLCGRYAAERHVGVRLEELSLPALLPLGVPSRLVERRPDVKAAEEQFRAANAQIGVAAGNMLPQFVLTALLGGGAASFGQMLAGANQMWGWAAGAGQTLFAGGTLTARKRAAEAAMASALAQYRAVVLGAFQNVADTLYAIDIDGRALAEARRAEEAAGKALALSTRSVAAGYAAEPVLLAARVAASQARLVRLQTYGVYLGDTAALHQALGGGWDASAATDTARR